MKRILGGRMDITIAARHCSITDAIRRRTERRLERLVRFESRATAAAVVFEEDHGRRRVELRLTVPGRGELLARGSGDTFPDAVAQAADRLERQLVRGRDRMRARRGPTIRVPELPELA
jgi:ribosomal subunit interface protein